MSEENQEAKKHTSRTLEELLKEVEEEDARKTPEQRAEEERKHHESWKRLATTVWKNAGRPDSWAVAWLKEKGYNPIFVTYMVSEQLFVFKTVEESKKAMKHFQEENNTNDGWWYGLDGKWPWKQTYIDYTTRDMESAKKLNFGYSDEKLISQQPVVYDLRTGKEVPKILCGLEYYE